MALGEKIGIIEKSGASYSYKNKEGEKISMGRGYDATRQFLKENIDLKNEILGKIRARLAEVK